MAQKIKIFETNEDYFLSDEIQAYVGSSKKQICISDSLNSTWENNTILKSDLKFDLESYPVRTNLALIRKFEDGSKRNVCSGTLVSKNIILTAAHCFVSFDTSGVSKWNGIESIFVAPLYKNGRYDTTYKSIKIEKVYIPDKFLETEYPYSYLHLLTDFALVKITQNIGLELGWSGITTPSQAERHSILYNRGYNFSYPGTLPYTGDDMYFTSSFLSTVNTYNYYHDGIKHIVGQSGSSYFYLDKDTLPVIFGLINTQEHQYYIPENLVKGINKLNQELMTVGLESYKGQESVIFPNPFIDKIYLNTNFSHFDKLEILDMKGNVLIERREVLENQELDLGNLDAGLYIILVYSGDTISKALIEKN